MTVGRQGFAAALVALAIAGGALAQSAPAGAPPGPSPARVAVDTRKAAFTLIGVNFRPLAATLKGAPIDGTEAEERAKRVAFLSGLLGDAFPDVSNLGQPDTKAKPELWANRPDFEKKLKDLQTHAAALQQAGLTEKGTTDAFKSAVAAVAQDCKACHDSYRIQ